MHGFRFFEPGGNEVDVVANPYGPEGGLDCGPCPTTVTVSDDGSRLAWLEGADAGEFFVRELVVTETFTGTELRRVSIPDGLGILGPLDLHDETIVVNRQDNDGAWLAALVIDLSGSQLTAVTLATAAQARLLRAELAVGGGPVLP